MNSKKRGDVGLGAAIAYFTQAGGTVSIPLTDSQHYDLIIDDGLLQRVQVKTTSYFRDGRFRVQLSTKGGNKSRQNTHPFDASQIDWLFVLVSDGSIYVIPSHAITAKHDLPLGRKYEQFKRTQ